jgi:hypothetical protein
MPDVIKLKGPTVTLTTTANAVGNATIVRIVHSSAGNADRILTQSYANGTAIANTYLLAGETLYLLKGTTDTLKTDNGTDVFATPVAYS